MPMAWVYRLKYRLNKEFLVETILVERIEKIHNWTEDMYYYANAICAALMIESG